MAANQTRRDFLRSGISALSSAWLASGCCQHFIPTNYAWNNALFTAGIDPKVLRDPASLGELVELVQRAEREKVGIRMVGAGHSFSDVAMSDGYMLRPTHLNAMLELDRSQLKPPFHDDPQLVRVEAGIPLHQLNPALFERGRALENMGGWDAQTIVGAACTGTHGSGIDYGPIASQLVSLQVVTAGGAVCQIERSDGITDPHHFPGYIETRAGRIPATLLQNDQTFDALAVSMGCMGIVYAVILRTAQKFWLREVRELTSWSELTKAGGFLDRLLHKQRLDPNAPADPEHYEIYFNPYPPHRCLLTKRYRTFDEPKNLTLDARKRGQWGADIISTVAMVSGRGNALVDFLNRHPAQVPKTIDDALAALADHEYIDVSYNVFNLGPANLFRVSGVELGFDVAQTVRATERHFAIAAELQKDGVVHSSPPSLRFVKRSSALLAMMYERDTLMLEMGMIVGADGADRLLKTFERKYIDEFGARPHWGLDMNILQDFSDVRALYPAADRWLEIYRRLNASGAFNAEFTDRLGISVKS